MRVLIAPDRMGALSSSDAGRVLADGWPGAMVRPAGEAGAGFGEATADRWRVPLQSGVVDGVPLEWAATPDRLVLALRDAPSTVPSDSDRDGAIPYAASSVTLGHAVTSLLVETRPTTLLLDLAGLDTHDAGAGLLAGLGARGTGAELTAGVEGLHGLADVDLAPVRERLAGIELVGVVPSSQRDDPLLGLRGITSRRGRAAGEDAARLLATDAVLQRLTELVAPDQAHVAGAGACGGLGWAVLALGGRLSTGPRLALAGAPTALDLVVTGCEVFDFASRGGGVVAAAAALAADRLCPCVVVAGEVLIGGREMRTLGVEAAYAVRPSTADRPTGAEPVRAVRGAELAQTVTRVSRSWRW